MRLILLDVAFLLYLDLHPGRRWNGVLYGSWRGGGGGGIVGGGYSKVCVGVTLGSDDLINIPACEANLLHSEGCSCDRTTHEGDIGEQAGGVETHPWLRHAQTQSHEDYMHAHAC